MKNIKLKYTLTKNVSGLYAQALPLVSEVGGGECICVHEPEWQLGQTIEARKNKISLMGLLKNMMSIYLKFVASLKILEFIENVIFKHSSKC